MPIGHIHSPEQLVSGPSIVNSPTPLPFWVRGLHAQRAQLDVLEPGFAGDITPHCFERELVIPAVRFMIEVASAGEATVHFFMFPGSTAMAGRFTVKGSTLKAEPNKTDFTVSEKQKHLLLAYSDELNMYVGGLVLFLTTAQVAQYAQAFPKHD